MLEDKSLDTFTVVSSQKVKERDYWLARLSGELVKTTFPYDFNKHSPNKKDSHKFKIPGELFSRIMRISNNSDIRLFVSLAAALNVLINKYSYHHVDDIIVGTSIYRQDLDGEFVNTVLTLRNKLQDNMTFKQLLKEFSQTLKEAVQQQNYPIENLLYQLNMTVDQDNFPLFDIFILLENIHDKNYIKHINTNMNIFFLRTDDGIEGEVAYNPCLFAASTIARITRHFIHLLEEMLFKIDIPLAHLNLLSKEEKKQILFQLDCVDTGYPKDKTIHGLFEDQVKRTPDKASAAGDSRGGVSLTNVQLTYKELNCRANRLAHLLRQKRVQPETIVGILMERSVEMIMGIIAILKAGGAYLPIDPAYPEERISYMLADSKATILLTTSDLNERVKHEKLLIKLDEQDIYRGENSNLEIVNHPSDTASAYIIYTSGTTGRPKGAVVEHENIVRLLFNEKFQFDFNEADVWTLFHSYCFDFSVWEMYGALLYGAKLLVIPKTVSIDPVSFWQILRSEGVTVLNQTPTSFHHIAHLETQAPQNQLKLKYVIFGGERLNPAELKQWKQKYPDTKLINMYGITETTVHVTYKEITEEEIESEISNIGKPLPTLSAYVLDKDLNLIPVGIPGELCVGGKGVCRGYLYRDSLTKEKFVENPFRKGEKLYRSGDLARLLENGDLEYLGRIDEQVKIRGYRIELQEIETQLQAHQSIKKSVVIAREDLAGGKYLAAYFVSHQDIPGSALREYLAKVLPDYMIPAYFIQIPQVPLTANGKLDKKALPEPGDVEEEYIAPGNQIEETLSTIWADVLELQQVGIRSNFFNIGGDSIKAIRVISKINQLFDTGLKIPDLYQNETIEKMAHCIVQQGSTSSRDVLEEVKTEINALKQKTLKENNLKEQVEDIFPLSDIQKGMVFGALLNPEEGVYLDQFAYRLVYPDFEPERFKKALQLLIDKHMILRTCFNMSDYDTEVQMVYRNVPVKVRHRDLTSREKHKQEDYIRQLMQSERTNTFDLTTAPLWRMSTFDLGNNIIVVVWQFHHAILDGWSNASILTELNNIYLRLKTEPHFVPAPINATFKDSIIEQMAEKRSPETLRFWQEELADYKRLDILNKDDCLIKYSRNLGASFLEQVNLAAQKYNTSIKTLGFAAYIYMMNMVSYENDIVVGLITNSRPDCVDGDKVAGCFLNTVPVRIKIPTGLTWREYIEQVDRKLVEVKRREKLSLFEIARLVGESTEEGNPIFDAVFGHVDFYIYKDLHQPEKTGNHQDKSENTHDIITGYETTNTLFDFGIVTTGGVLAVVLTCKRTPVCDVETLMGYYLKILENMINAPDHLAAKENILPGEEKREMLYQFNRTKTAYPENRPLHELFEEQAARTPDRIALRGTLHGQADSLSLTYRELNEKSNQLARFLGRKGVGPDTVVAMMFHRSLQMIIGILAVLKSGGTYLPIRPDFPENRVSSMLKDTQAAILLTHSDSFKQYSYTRSQDMGLNEVQPLITSRRPQILDLDQLPVVDRGLINYEKYSQYISQAPVTNVITMQGTRGCPYKCAYCHKIWPKNHVFRSAENIFSELLLYYRMGIRRFALIDDIFNMNIENSSKFFRMIIDNGLEVQLFFPSGMRGDILTKDYIDLLVKAGTANLPLALETASLRLQKLIGKNLKIEKLQENMEYICKKHPHLILELYLMHGFPSETEEEALMTMDLVKRMKWIHFPYLFILKIWPNTEMAELAMKCGVSPEAIAETQNLAYHHAAVQTSPFDKSFTSKIQTDLTNNYFLAKERLLHVLPHQMNVLTEDEIVKKYNSYLPMEIKSFEDVLQAAGISKEELGNVSFADEKRYTRSTGINQKLQAHFQKKTPDNDALNILLLDLSQYFSDDEYQLNDLVEQPLGLMYLMSYLNQSLGSKINGKIAKSRIDFDNYDDLKQLLAEFKPDVIGIRTLSLYRNFFHMTVAMIRQWGFEGPIIAGGPYATSDHRSVLYDGNIDVAVLGEGEITFLELVTNIMENNKKLPGDQVLEKIPGIAFIKGRKDASTQLTREIIMLDTIQDLLAKEPSGNLHYRQHQSSDLAYIVFTSGSTGKPKGTMIEHTNVSRVVKTTNYIDIQPRDIILQLSNYAFDGSVFDIYGALLNGAKLVMIKEDDLLDTRKLSAFIKEEKITVFFVTTALFNILVDNDIECFSGIRHVLFGGERVSLQHVKKAFDYMKGNRVIHMYGPTETTVYATFHSVNQIDETQETVPIGKPLSNTTVYILDKNMKPLPLGAAGEIFIGGAGVARGYINRVEFTREKFVANPFVENDRLYRTGDLARWLPDGQIEFLDRIDTQVKLRGFRIELGEIESQLLNQDNIKEALVLAKEDDKRGKYLCAYIVADEKKASSTASSRDKEENIDFSQVKERLASHLPDYMIPAYFVQLKEMPLTLNGKVDKKALPEPGISAGENYIAPRNTVERILTVIWAEVLDIKKEVISIDANFFELGGHSLNATVLAARIHKELDVKVPLSEIFRTQTVLELANYINRSKQDMFVSIEPTDKKEYYELSSAQKRLYIMQQMEPGSTGYNINGSFPLDKDFDTPGLEKSFKQLIKRHDCLRTSFQVVNETPVQVVHDQVKFEIEYYNLTDLHDILNSYVHVRNAFARSFDLTQAPLFRIGLIDSPTTGNKVLMVDMHHIISDGRSIEVLVKEFEMMIAGKELPRLRLQYKDYAAWQNSQAQQEKVKQQLAYWLEVFSGEVPIAVSLADYPRPPVLSFEGDFYNFNISPAHTQQLKAIARQNDTTLFMNLLAVLNILLFKYSGQTDIIIGSTVSGRPHTDFQNMIGMFVNMLPMRNYPDKNKTYLEFLQEVKENSLKAFENQDLPFEELIDQLGIERDPSRSPLFDITFEVHSFDVAVAGQGNENYTEPDPTVNDNYKNKTSVFDISLEAMDSGEEIFLRMSYITRLFKKETIRRLCSYFKEIVSSVVKNPGARISELEMVSEKEGKQLLQAVKDSENKEFVEYLEKSQPLARSSEAEFDF
jgi:amino acid adenylation domain-containing protein